MLFFFRAGGNNSNNLRDFIYVLLGSYQREISSQVLADKQLELLWFIQIKKNNYSLFLILGFYTIFS